MDQTPKEIKAEEAAVFAAVEDVVVNVEDSAAAVEQEAAVAAVAEEAAAIDPLADPLGAGLGVLNSGAEVLNSGADALVGGVTGGVEYVSSFPDSVTKLFVCGDVPAAEVTPEPSAGGEPRPESPPEIAAQ